MAAFRAAHDKRDARVALDLRDAAGERVIAARRLTTRASITDAGLRREVSLDLQNLLNTTNLESVEDLADAPEVARSILNYGFPDLTHRTIDENELSEIARELETALSLFEPRLARQSIRARRDASAQAEDLKLRFLVEADLRVEPVSVPIEFAAEVELDTGAIKVERL